MAIRDRRDNIGQGVRLAHGQAKFNHPPGMIPGQSQEYDLSPSTCGPQTNKSALS